MIARNSASSEHSSFLPSSESSMKTEAARSSGLETEYSLPTTVNGSESPKSSVDENTGNESLTANSPSPSITPNLRTTINATSLVSAITSSSTTPTATVSPIDLNNSIPPTASFFGNLKNSAQMPVLDINSVFGNFLCVNNKLSTFLTEQKTLSTTPPNTQTYGGSGGMNGLVDPSAFFQHFLAAQPSPPQQIQLSQNIQSNPSPPLNENLIKSEFKEEIGQGNNNLQDRKRVW